MSKQYGLIIPGQQKKPTAPAPREISRPSIFDESSDDDEKPQLKVKMKAAPSANVMERRMARRMQEKALEEDPTVFQYDELYDAMESKREEEKQTKSNEPKKPKYIGRLMEHAERRKLENELRLERQVQKEREEEGEQFKDKESFVTSTYRKKLEEMRKLEEQEKRDEYLEAIGDVTKQKDLDGFYRHLFEQKLGTARKVQKPGMSTSTKEDDSEKVEDEEIAYKPIKSGRTQQQQQRAYRKRHSSDEEDEKSATAATETKKVHLQNNIDADSDFSIDSSSSSEDEDVDGKSKKQQSEKETQAAMKQSTVAQMDPTKIAINLEGFKKEKAEATSATANESKEEALLPQPATPAETAKPKKDKSDIWKKRTVGEEFDAAVKRYFERKAARNA